ncbi:hypothetical protein Pmar_PMAR024240 [Perkinsus marinus ATCC 50983]|uniref:Uncharacterized protein n=1 Tax=Perkinsus marinus (strain ATCC 50983 / TXsc) TaxID=423536 RepID=C5LMJ0_PERM5|nr:hypothetical protein Pmar_PMAR024240 [Perkinsus marinus ATCC 50983]EER02055.1 hypothetical protein Pmar_PMAR024240 [Perkinsus marinus ATCC 50983]|eukprot:XP_002769337.1 hypothetical protein Pmar_PMAR024240 [Perkinsus marinus ATCC 50983]
MDSTSALGKIEGRLNSSTYQPTTRQTKRWFSRLADLLEYDEADITYRHAKGKDNSFRDLLSRLAQGGQRYVSEGGGEAFALMISTSSSQSELPTTDRSASVHDSTRCILAGGLRVQLITLQKADSSTLLHGATLQAWQHHFDGTGKLQKLAAEAKALGLVTHVGGVVMTISEAVLTEPISVPVIPGGVVTGLNGMIGTNADTD